MMNILTQRQKKLFRWVVQRYIGTAMPVGSDQLVKHCRLDCSPATVRNEMVCLEEAGFVRQPHTSAGRIPTDQGYRFYVDSLMKREDMRPDEESHIHEGIYIAKGNAQDLLDAASRLLSQISEELAVVITPSISRAVFDRLELIALSEKKVLMVLHVRHHRVKTIIFQTQEGYSEADLVKSASLLNERLSGLTLDEIRQSTKMLFAPSLVSDYAVIAHIVQSVHEFFNFSGPLEIHASGTHHILSQPEFSDPVLLKGIFSIVEDKNGLVGLFQDKPQSVNVTIGSENKDERLQSFSVISASYQMGNEDGFIGVIGPTRMRYEKILTLVGHMAQTVTGCFS
jgi:heat-inducible transcriptional repressor